MHAEVVKFFVRGLLQRHPLPWRLERDWTWEVIDADNTCFAKFQSDAAGQELIDFAVKLADEDAKAAEEANRFLREAGIDPLE